MHPSGSNIPDKPPLLIPNILNGISLDPQVLGHYRDTLFDQQGVQPNNEQQIQFLAQLSHQQQQALVNQLQSTIIAQGGKLDPLLAVHHHLAQQQHQQAMLRHHQQHQQQVELQRQRERARGPPVMANHQIDEQNQALTVTFTTLVGTTSVTVPLQRAMAFNRVQNPHISTLFLEQMLTQHQLLNPLHCHRIEVPGIEGGLVYYHPMALISILKGVLEQVDIMQKTIHQIGNALPNATSNPKMVANHIRDIQAQATEHHRNLSEARRRNSFPVQNMNRNNGRKEDGTSSSLVVPEPTLLSPRGAESVRDVPVVTVQQSLKRPSPINGDQEASKRARPEIFQQIEQLQASAAALNHQSSSQYASQVQQMIDTITASWNNANQILTPLPAEAPIDSSRINSNGNDGAKVHKHETGGVTDCSVGLKPVKTEDTSPEVRIIKEVSRNLFTSTTTLIDQGKAQRPLAASEKEILARTLPKISTEEQTATEVLLRLRNQPNPGKMLKTTERNLCADAGGLTLHERVALPGKSNLPNTSAEFFKRPTMDHQCSSKCTNECIRLGAN